MVLRHRKPAVRMIISITFVAGSVARGGDTDISCKAYVSVDIPQTIGVERPNRIASTIFVPAAEDAPIVDVNVPGIVGTHTGVGDLSFTLNHGVSVTIADFGEGGSGCRKLSSSFHLSIDDDASPARIPCQPTADRSYQPNAGMFLNAFNGTVAEGAWVLEVIDSIAADGGELHAWQLQICTAPALIFEDQFETENGVF